MNDFSEVLGDVRAGRKEINALPTGQKKAVAVAILNEAAKVEHGNPVSPALRRAASLGEDFAARLAGGSLRLAETTKVFIAKITAAGTKLTFVGSGDQEKRGVRDIAFSGLPKDKPFYLRGIRLRQSNAEKAIAAGIETTKDEAAELDFDYVDKVLSTGALTIRVGNKDFVSKLGCSMFNNKGNSSVNPGYYELANPVWIPAEKNIEIFIDESATLPAKTFAWLELIGFDTDEK